MKKKTHVLHKLVVACAVAAFACFACVGLAGCDSTDDRVAGKVFDYEITEQDVIDYIDDYRDGSALKDDADWAAWMEKNNTTAEALRKEVITYLAQNKLVERAAGLKNVSVSDSEVDEEVESRKSQYTSDMAFTRALINSGYTEEYYKLSVKSELLKDKIKSTYTSPSAVSDEELASYADYKIQSMRTKRTSAIFISTGEDGTNALSAKAEASDARNELLEGKKFAKVFKEYSDQSEAFLSEDGDMGFDIVSVPSLEYKNALIKLSEVGDVSEVVKADDGFYVFVVTEIFEEREGRAYRLDEYPEVLLDQWRQELANQTTSTAYDEFMNENVSDVQIAIEPMPDGLPYDVATEE